MINKNNKLSFNISFKTCLNKGVQKQNNNFIEKKTETNFMKNNIQLQCLLLHQK